MRSLALADREAVSALLREQPREQSELTFTNLFIWRDAYQLRLSEAGGALAIFSWRADPEDSFLFPPLGQSANASVVRGCLEHLRANGHAPVMARATQADLQRLGLTEPDFAIEPDRDNWDYVYLVRDLVELSGSRYHRKRNHLEQFTSQHRFAYRKLTADLVPACRELQDKWCDEKQCDLMATLRAENSAVKEVLDNLETLGVTGGCIEIEGRIEAFTLGELLNPDTVVIHIEKANAAFHGLYQLINQQFLEHEWQHARFVNREQDLGIQGLRKAKESYYPDHMVEKSTVRLR
jgi:hypothetical protein